MYAPLGRGMARYAGAVMTMRRRLLTKAFRRVELAIRETQSDQSVGIVDAVVVHMAAAGVDAEAVFVHEADGECPSREANPISLTFGKKCGGKLIPGPDSGRPLLPRLASLRTLAVFDPAPRRRDERREHNRKCNPECGSARGHEPFTCAGASSLGE